MPQTCNQLPANAKQAIPHLVSVITARALPRSGHCQVAFPGQMAHLGGRRVLRAAPKLCRPLHAILDTERKLRLDKYFEVEMTVRDSDLDKYGVVNNAIYASYIDKGREMLLAGLGFSTDSLASRGCALATSELNLKYFAPLKDKDKFVVMMRPVEIKGVRIFAEYFIETLPNRNVVLKAVGSFVCLNKDYRPTRVFPELSTKLLQFFASDDDKLN
ncbi:acyl-acyl carrier protein thioesterase ATL3, chloroplastic-like isoform X1 [Panicum virgatum]|uniref:Thioesterase domain-containing protein n=1 Tax=Panicum virgatum TaxID=38727 RepID=A0A8T0QCC0_PANVG|nr:acyl-acyl carrier protein thioesterase ATL3, chloroplastic-like isoform X1 [Panicum virgatum]KAG2570868.1 hypothetical protein PVAP13_7KG013754 [Panicum virgatum]